MPVPQQKVDQYIKVRRLANGTSGPERDSALGILRKLEEGYPGIEAEADAVEARTSDSQPASWDWAQVIFEGLNWAVETASGVAKGRELGHEPRIVIRHKPDGSSSLTVHFTETLLDELRALRPTQAEAFIKTLNERIADRLVEDL